MHRAAPPGQRPWLEFDFQPRRAGTNLMSAAIDFELIVRNIGRVPACDVRVQVSLLNASAQQDARLRTIFETPIEKPAIAPFALDPAAEAAFSAMAMLPLQTIEPIMLSDRPMFAPLVAINAVYDWGEGAIGQAAVAMLLGIDKSSEGGEAEAGKMAPIWLDRGPRMFTGIAQRPYHIGKLR